MKLKYRLIFLALLLAGGLFFLIHSQQKTNQNENPINSLETDNQIQKQASAVPAEVKNKKLGQQIQDFSQNFHIQSLKAGQIDETPEKTENELFAMAQKLSATEMKQLKNIVLSTQAEGDDRSLAAYLLSLNQSPEVISIVQDLVTQSIPDLKDERRNSFEQALRAQVLENLESHPNHQESLQALTNIINKTDSSFLVDRAQRAHSHIQNKTPTTQEQDLKALRKLAH